MPKINLSTGSVYYSDSGKGMPVVLHHANPGDSKDFEAVIPTLSKGYRVLALDWPGYGQSDMLNQPESANVLLYFKVLREFLEELALPPAFFIGNSIGGNVVARLASEVPEAVRGLVLVAPGGFTPQNFISNTFCKFQGSRFSMSPYRLANFYIKKRSPTTRSILKRAATVQAAPERIALNRAMWRSFGKPENDLRQLAQNIKAPTLLLFGKHDPVIPAKKDGRIAAQSIPSASFVSLPCGHVSFAEVPELFLSEVEPFIKKCSNNQS